MREDADPEELELVNFAQFDAMIDGPESPCVSIYRDFVSGARASIRAIREAAEKGDRVAVESIGHQLKGAAASLGLSAFSGRMAEVEDCAKQGRGLEVIAAVQWLEEAIRTLEQSVVKVRSKRGIGE